MIQNTRFQNIFGKFLPRHRTNNFKFFSSIPKIPKKLPIAGVKNVLLVSSAKGGVGKSSISVNLAYAMKILDSGQKVGILDADVYGPSLPTMTGLKGKPVTNKQNMMLPLVNFGVKCMSMGFLVEEENPIIWRGLMVMSALEKLLRTVNWGELDILVVDMPPGTGDTQLSIIQNIPINGVLIVSTPQKVCLADMIRGTNMYRKLDIPIIGFVKNMSHFICDNCSHSQLIFDSDEMNELTKKFNVDLLSEIPLDRNIAICSDSGCPIVVKNIHCNTAKIFLKLAEKVLLKLNLIKA